MSNDSLEHPRSSSSLKTWSCGRGEDKVVWEGTYLEVMVNSSILVRNNRKYGITTLYITRYAPPEMSINEVQEGLTKSCSIVVIFFKESECIFACPEVTKLHYREEWTHNIHQNVIPDTEGRDSDDKERVILPLIYPSNSYYNKDYNTPVHM